MGEDMGVGVGWVGGVRVVGMWGRGCGRGIGWRRKGGEGVGKE